MFVQIKNQIRMQIASSLFFSLSLSISISHSLHSSLRVTNHTFPYPSSPNFPLFPPLPHSPHPFNHLASNTPLINTPTKNQREKLTLSGFASHQAWRRRRPKPSSNQVRHGRCCRIDGMYEDVRKDTKKKVGYRDAPTSRNTMQYDSKA